jgi:S1-C subfamily serine protease
MARMRALVLGTVLLAAAPLGAAGGDSAGERSLRAAIHAASVAVGPNECSGVLAESPQLVMTARHCVQGEGQRLTLRFTTGWTRSAWVVAVDEAADQAVLFLEDPVPIEPLVIARRQQVPGTVLYFEGHPDRPRFQSARLDRIGRCPSLPDLPNALFTSIDGVPGDSGAPLIDAAARIVGLVHGGARCHIATPGVTLARLVDRVLDRDVATSPGPAAADRLAAGDGRAPQATRAGPSRGAASSPRAPRG